MKESDMRTRENDAQLRAAHELVTSLEEDRERKDRQIYKLEHNVFVMQSKRDQWLNYASDIEEGK
jgi:hypothetical protein